MAGGPDGDWQVCCMTYQRPGIPTVPCDHDPPVRPLVSTTETLHLLPFYRAGTFFCLVYCLLYICTLSSLLLFYRYCLASFTPTEISLVSCLRKCPVICLSASCPRESDGLTSLQKLRVLLSALGLLFRDSLTSEIFLRDIPASCLFCMTVRPQGSLRDTAGPLDCCSRSCRALCLIMPV
jgi:hypothetical protein